MGIECAADTCVLSCDDGSEVVDGSSKTKCLKGKDGSFSWTKDLGNCGMTMDHEDEEKPDGEKPEDDEEKPDGEKPDGEKPDGEKPEDDEEKPDGEKPEDDEEGEKPEGPAPVGEDGKWQKC